MVIGEALSGMADGGEKKLDFQMEETKTDEAIWYKDLIKVDDIVGPIDLLLSKSEERPKMKKPAAASTSKAKSTAIQKVPAPRASGFIIEEVDDTGDEEEEDDDLAPYTMPDSDPEDSDEDPTLIRRDKPRAPVYVRDLITYLRDSENYDKQKLALATAPTLIRRKASYGTEVSSHIEDLASLLVGIQDKFDLDDFYQLRLQGMIALVVAQPEKMGQWFSKTFFDGDYSLSQRASILIVLGLSARELAGFDTSEYASATAFPSKKLPERIEKLYLDSQQSSDKQIGSGSPLKALPPNALDTVAQSLTSSFLAPIAAEAADATTGPGALKLSSFTSKLQKTKASGGKAKTKAQVRSIPNTTAALISKAFFFPLAARFQYALRASSGKGVIFQPYLLSMYLKTLGLLVHAAGPTTLSLPQMTSELWDLILALRGHCAGDIPAIHSLLFALAALLDVNGDQMRQLCESHPREMIETQEWVTDIFNGTRGEDGGEENNVKMLAAGILIKLREAVEKYRMLLMGDMIGFT
jgi:telomere length regulation protein